MKPVACRLYQEPRSVMVEFAPFRRELRRCAFRLILILLSLLSVTVAPALADVTVRYESRVIVNPALPPQAVEQLKKSAGVSFSPVSVQQFRNGKLRWSNGDDESILNLGKREITLLERESRRYTTLPLEQYKKEFGGGPSLAAPPSSTAPAALKGSSQSIVTGRTATIHGVEAEEQNLVLTIDARSGPGLQILRIVMHVWTARDSEVTRVAALREVAKYNLEIFDVVNPASLMQKSFQQTPGLGEGFTSAVGEFRSRDLLMRVTLDVFSPVLGLLLGQEPPGAEHSSGAAFNPDEPLLQMTQELTDISTAELSDSLFEVPSNYSAVTLAQLLSDN